MKSIKLRLCILLTTIATITAGGVSAVTYGVVHRSLYREFDYSLRSTTSALHALTEYNDGKVGLDSGPATLPQFKIESRRAYFVLTVQPDNVIVGQSANLELLKPRVTDTTAEQIVDVAMPDHHAGRQLVTFYQPRREDEKKEDILRPGEVPSPTTQPMPTLKLVVAEDCENIVRTMRLLSSVLAGATAGFALLAGVGSYVLVGRSLRPLRDLSVWTSRINARSLNERLAPGDWPAEVMPIADGLNSLMERLQEAFDRERRFSGNISHELRTPVAELQTLSDIARRWPDDPIARQHLLLGSSEIAAHMTRLINTLLLVSRLQRGDQIELETIDLSLLTTRALERHHADLRARHIDLRASIEPRILCPTNATIFTQILDNLLTNVVSHAPESCISSVSFTRDHGGLLTISNPAPDLTPDDIPKLTEPLWRKEASRTNQSHAGLGLHLTQLFCDALGATLTLSLTPAHRLQIQIQLNRPLQEPTPSQATAAPALAGSPVG